MAELSDSSSTVRRLLAGQVRHAAVGEMPFDFYPIHSASTYLASGAIGIC